MAQLIIPGVYLCSIKGVSGGQDVVNVIGVDKGFSSADEIAQAVAIAWSGPTGPITLMNQNYTFESVTATDLTTPNGAVATFTAPLAGPIVSNLSTNAASALVVYGGGTRSRSSKGRMYFGPLSEVQINADGRTLNPTYRTALRVAMNSFQLELAQNGMLWCVISRKLQVASIIDPVGIAVQPVVATQRRRIRG